MNPEENNNQVPDADSLNQAIAPTPAPTPAPEVTPDPTTVANTAPSLDQVAADLTSAAAANTPLDAAPAEPATPAAPVTPTEPTVPAEPVTPVAPTESAITPAEPNPAAQAPAMPAPETIPAPEPVLGLAEPTPEPTPAPAPAAPSISIPVTEPDSAPAPEVNPFTEPVQPMPMADAGSASPVTPETPAMPEAPSMPETPAIPESPIALETPTADIPPTETPATDAPATTTPAEEEPPLVPAEPVPGSIGSAISYTDTTTQPLPAEKPKKSRGALKLSKDNIRLIAIIGAGIVIVAIVVIVIIAIASNSGTKKSANNNNNNTPAQPTTPTVSSLTCSKEGGSDVFSNYGEVTSGKEDIVVMYSDGYLSSFGTNLNLNYETEEAAQFGSNAARDEYNRMLAASNLTSDPFDSAYNVVDNALTVTHQADGDTIDASNARALGLYVVKGEVVDDPDTLIDNYETDGYTCVEK